MITTPNFLKKCRQPFLTEASFKTTEKSLINVRSLSLARLHGGEMENEDKPGMCYGIAGDNSHLLMLRYTAGEEIEKLRPMMDEVVSSWEEYVKVDRENTSIPDNPAFLMHDRTSYNVAIQITGLLVLLKRQDLLPRWDAVNPGFSEMDGIYAEIVKPYLPNVPYVDDYYHAWPYEEALNAIDSKDPKEQSELMGEAVEDWYPANEGVPFHDTHKQVDDDGTGGYFGYWCFELAALCYIFNIDDSRFRDHITYPKDLVDFARKSGNPTSLSFASSALAQGERLRAEAGQPCPREGFYFTPAKVGSRRFFKQGEIMPEVGGDYGATIWQCDGQQD